MGMQFNPMYQPTSTKTITVDGDLNLNPYDVLAVDGKFDTVEADEFVGGVGNFSSLTSAGNIVLNGDTDVKGLLHAEENLQVDGSLLLEGSINNVNIADDGAITTSKSITATGGFNGNLIGNTQGFLFVKGTVGTSGDVNYATCAAQSVTIGLSAVSMTVNNYSIVFANPTKHGIGVYTRRSDLSGTTSPSLSTRKLTITFTAKAGTGIAMDYNDYFYYKKSTDSSYTSVKLDSVFTSHLSGSNILYTWDVPPGVTYQFYVAGNIKSSINNGNMTITASIPAATTYKVTYATP